MFTKEHAGGSRRELIVGAVVSLVLVGAACGSSTKSGSSSTSAAPTTPATTSAPTTAPSSMVGTKLALDNKSTVQLLAYGTGTPTALYLAKPGMSLVAANVEGCVPVGGEATSFNPLYFSMMSDGAKEYVQLGAVEGQIESSSVKPGDCEKGNVGFDIPSSSKSSALYFQPISLNNQSPLKWTLPTTPSTPIIAPPTSPPTTEAVTTTTTLTMAQWGEKYGTDVTLVVGTANGLVESIASGNEVRVETSCSALGNNYDKLPVTGPPDPATANLYDQGRDAIYSAQHRCHGGLIRSADLATASQQAHLGATLLTQVLKKTGVL